MEEDMLLGNVSGTLFPDRSQTEIPDQTKTSSSTGLNMPNSNANVKSAVPIALEDGEPELGLSASNLKRLCCLNLTCKQLAGLAAPVTELTSLKSLTLSCTSC